MFTAEQYRAKASEYAKLMKTANGPNEVREYQSLERSFTELADNAQWVAEARVEGTTRCLSAAALRPARLPRKQR